MLTIGAFLLTAVAVLLLLRCVRRDDRRLAALGRIAPALTVRDDLPSVVAPDADAPAPEHRYLPLLHNVDPQQVHIVHPTAAQAQAGLARLRACVTQWAGKPALLVEDPDLALIVRLHAVMQGADGFHLRLQVEEVIGAPKGFDAPAGIERECGWNQPYLSFDEECVSAPYAFYLHFGEAGVARVREFQATLRAGNISYTSTLRGALRSCFSAAAWEEPQVVPGLPDGGHTAAGAGTPRGNAADS